MLETRYTNSDFPAELDQTYKVTRFVRESLRHLSDPDAIQNLVTASGARWVQSIIDEMGVRASQRPWKPICRVRRALTMSGGPGGRRGPAPQRASARR